MNDWPETDPSLILRIKDPQNALAWNKLIAIYRPVFYRLAGRESLPHEDAEDLVQAVFLSVAKAIDGWEHGGPAPFSLVIRREASPTESFRMVNEESWRISVTFFAEPRQCC